MNNKLKIKASRAIQSARSNNRPRRPMMRRRRRQQQRQSALPPLRNQLSSNYRTTLRVIWDVGNGDDNGKWVSEDSYSAVIDTGYIFTATTKNVSAIFTGYKVHSITARFLQCVIATESVGFNILSLVHPEFTSKSTQLGPLTASNASVIRQDGKPALVRYRPLEPSEFDWMTVGTKHTYAQCLVKTFPTKIESWLNKKSIGNNLWGKFIVDIDVSMNGYSSTVGQNSFDLPCACRTCTDPDVIRAHGIQDAFNAYRGGANLVPYLVEAVQAKVSPSDYMRAYTSSSSRQWYEFLQTIIPIDSPDQRHLQRILLHMQRNNVENVPSPIPSDYDIAE